MWKIKRIVAIAIAVCMLMCLNTSSIMATSYNEQNSDTGMEPYNIAILRTNYGFTINSEGKAVCYGEINIRSGYTAQLTMQLQQKSGMWKTVQSWSTKDSNMLMLDETYQVEKGYNYRLMVVYIAYDSEGNQVESFYDMSNIVEYN